MPHTTVLIAEDQTIVAEGLRAMLEDSFDVVGVVANAAELFETATRLQPDVIITEFSSTLLDSMRQIRSSGTQSKFVVLTMHTQPEYAESAFLAGASAYVVKHSAGHELRTALDEVIQGRIYVTPLIAKGLSQARIEAQDKKRGRIREPGLTPRQLATLRLIVEGRTMKEIAAVLRISVRTAEAHKYNMMNRLGLKTVAELIHYAIRSRVIEP